MLKKYEPEPKYMQLFEALAARGFKVTATNDKIHFIEKENATSVDLLEAENLTGLKFKEVTEK